MKDGLFDNARSRFRLTKERKFVLSWTIVTIILLITVYPIGHLSVIGMVIYAAFKLLPNLKGWFKKWLHWMSYDD